MLELGPLAGSDGGEIVYQGDLQGLLQTKTFTAKAMRDTLQLNIKPLPWTECYEIHDAKCHNLKHFDVRIPKGVLTAVTGVAGSGKGSLVCAELVNKCPDAIVINQKPIGTSIRSTPATYTGVMDEIRKLFAKMASLQNGLVLILRELARSERERAKYPMMLHLRMQSSFYVRNVRDIATTQRH